MELFYLIQLAFTWTKLLTKFILGFLKKQYTLFATSKSFKKEKLGTQLWAVEEGLVRGAVIEPASPVCIWRSSSSQD